jgi:omega-amidase
LKSFKAGLFQWDVALGCIEENVNKALDGLARLAREKTDLAILPEMWSCGFDNEHLIDHAGQTPAILDRLSSFAADKQMAVGGTLPERIGGQVANTFYLIGPDGRLSAVYRKIHLFTPGNEHMYFMPGHDVVTVDLPWGRMGLITCYDLRFPELARNLTLDGAEVLLIAAQWPRVRTAHWDILVQARAVENQTVVLAVNRCGKDPNQDYAGHSRIVNPWGETLALADTREAALTAEIESESLERARTAIPCLKDRAAGVYWAHEEEKHR